MMLRELSEPSVISTGSSSGGRSPISLRMSFVDGPATLRYSIESISEGELRLEATLETTLSDPRDALIDLLNEWTDGTLESLASVRRFLCHALISTVPDAGLEEAVESLNDIQLFHTIKPPQLPVSRSLQQKRASVGEARVRSKLVIEPEEP